MRSSGSGAASGRQLALAATREWGRCAFVGEGGKVEFEVSPLLIHRQVTLFGSWVTSLGHMEELLAQLVRWDLHPEVVVTGRFTLDRADEAFGTPMPGPAGKRASSSTAEHSLLV